MLQRVLEPEVMDTESEAVEYDSMDHREVNQRFAADFLAFAGPAVSGGPLTVLDVGAGTAQIPIEMARRSPGLRITAIDLAEQMLIVARKNVAAARLTGAITLERVDAKRMPYRDGQFDAVVSNSIVHHIPEPLDVQREMRRVLRAGGWLFVRDLLRPDSEAQLDHLVELYAGDANAHQRQMFRDSLHAALTLSEVRKLLEAINLSADAVSQTSDRHWTIAIQV
jgi:ubiquinone/menaquinone biosynthesis C-methylase UbiE